MSICVCFQSFQSSFHYTHYAYPICIDLCWLEWSSISICGRWNYTVLSDNNMMTSFYTTIWKCRWQCRRNCWFEPYKFRVLAMFVEVSNSNNLLTQLNVIKLHNMLYEQRNLRLNNLFVFNKSYMDYDFVQSWHFWNSIFGSDIVIMVRQFKQTNQNTKQFECIVSTTK